MDMSTDQVVNTRPIPMAAHGSTTASANNLLRKVPEVVLFFWIIKILCTTVGETAADFLNDNMGLGLTGTSLVMGALLIGALVLQFRSRSYTPVLYWLVVVLMSVVGTLITDNMVENFGISLEASTIGFAVLLTIAFVLWYASERTLSIHSIYTHRREAFYWTVILLTFALGTAAGDLVAEQLGLGYLVSALWFGAAIVALFAAHRFLGLGAIVAFWTAYILTRPLGASIGDYMSQSTDDGGLALGTVVTSFIFLGAIVLCVVYLVLSRADAPRSGVGDVTMADD